MGISKLCCRHSSETDSESPTPFFERFSCGVGSVMLDMTRQLLFSFRLVFFMKVLGLSAANAGWLILYGLIFNGAMTPLTAFLVDRINIPFLSRKLGRRKSWHLVGTVLEVIIIPLYFSSCLPCQSDRTQWQPIIYILALNTVVSFAHSLLEIGHLSLIPVIAKDQSEAVELNAWRTAFTFLSGIVTYLVAWAIFGQDTSDQISAENSMDFTKMTLILIGISLLFTLIFHAGTKEPPALINNRRSTTDTDFKRKSSFIPPHSLLQSMVFMRTDVHYRKEIIRDRFIERLKTKEEPHTEDGATMRKKSFTSLFVDALFSDENEENKAEEELSSDEKGVRETISNCSVIDTSPPSKMGAQDDDGMLKDLKELPAERKKSVFMSIVYGLIGLDDATGEHVPNAAEETKNCNGMNSSNGTIRAKLPSDPNATNSNADNNGTATSTLVSTETLGVDNRGLDCNELELRPCYPDKITSMESALPVAPAQKTVRAWLKDPHLYKVAIIFACTKVLQEVCYAYLPLFLIYRVQFGKNAIAYLPLIMLVTATVCSGISKKLVGIIGSKCSFILAALLVIGAGLWFYFITQSNRMMTYPAIILLGLGFSTMLVNSLSFAAELIGDNKSTSGVVFAVMSLLSRLTGGVLIVTIQKLFPLGSNSEDCEECGDYVRHVFSFVPGSLAAISVLTLLLFQASQTACKRNAPKTDASITESKGATDTRL